MLPLGCRGNGKPKNPGGLCLPQEHVPPKCYGFIILPEWDHLHRTYVWRSEIFHMARGSPPVLLLGWAEVSRRFHARTF